VCNFEQMELSASDRFGVCRLGRLGILAAMFQISGLMTCDQTDDTGPKPGRRIERFRPIATQVFLPIVPRDDVHLARMRAADNSRQISADIHGFVLRQTVKRELQILRTQFPNNDGAAQ
jgi:hypothetical protein